MPKRRCDQYHCDLRNRDPRVVLFLLSVVFGWFLSAPCWSQSDGERPDLWSLRPIAKPLSPAIGIDLASDSQRFPHASHPIDRFLAKALPQRDASSIQALDRDQLLQRLSLDLVGLRATDEEVEQFQSDRSESAFETQVDRLLGDPRYGEHWARLWLDTVRYSDSNGFDWDEFRKEAWRYRDFVVRAFNTDLPYDRFVLWQLAGDELLAGPPTTTEEVDQLIATGYLRLGPFDNAAKLFNEQDRARAEVLADLTETTGAAFLALTLSCCRCHDHKTDPLSQQDHYRFRAFFAATEFDDATSIDLKDEQERIEAANRKIDAQLEGLLGSIQQKSSPEDQKEVEGMKEKIEQLTKSKQSATSGLLMRDNKDKIDSIRLLEQGDLKRQREEVEPGFPSVLFPNAPQIESPAQKTSTGRRLALARWIVSPENPWAARVIVNRVWMNLFGQGLVSTPNDFGITGGEPLSTELLDHLATYLMDQNWSVKALVRYIVTSQAYAESVGDWRRLRRLSAEQMRDVVLQATGELQYRSGGPPVWPSVSEDVLQSNPATLDDNETKTKGWYPSAASEQTVRSIYLIQKRTVRVPWMETFDQPENTVSCARREVSIVPSQALALLNSDWVAESATRLATRIRDVGEREDVSEREGVSDRQASIIALYRATLGRAPTNRELERCSEFLDEGQSLAELILVLLNSNELAFIP